MNTRFYCAGILGACLALAPLQADIIPDGHHTLDRCVKIVNTHLFPDIAVIAAVQGPGVHTAYEARLIANDSCISKGYKFNSLTLLWTRTAVLTAAGGLDNINLSLFLDPDVPVDGGAVHRLPGLADPYGGTVPDSNPLVSEILEFSLVLRSGQPQLALTKATSFFRNGTNSISTYDPTPVRESRMNVESTPFQITPRNIVICMPDNGRISGTVVDCAGRTVLNLGRTGTPGTINIYETGFLKSGFYWISLRTQQGAATRRLQIVR